MSRPLPAKSPVSSRAQKKSRAATPLAVFLATLAVPLILFGAVLLYQRITSPQLFRRPSPALIPRSESPSANSGKSGGARDDRSRTIALPSPMKPDAAAGSKRIVLILDDVGFDGQPLSEAGSIDATLNFAVIPGTPNARTAAEMLHRRGHEILCHLPMEPIGFPAMSPGPDAILVRMSNDEIHQVTLRDLDAIPHARGVNNHMGSRATSDRRVMRETLKSIKSRGLYFVDSRTSASSVGAATARNLGVKNLSRDIFLDDTKAEADIRRQIDRLSSVASRTGLAVGIGHVHPTTIRVLQERVPALKKQGFSFIRASQAVQ